MSKPGIFTSEGGKSLAVPFILVSSLFLLWGFCNGMIDVMDKHFQKELHLTLAQSAWVQFAHYLGYFLMAMPAGWLASKLGYKGGIIAGLLMVAVGGFWFIPATKIATFPAFLLGVCVIASGLTFLETVANPYTTVLGPKQFAATRINLAQSCNGIGWIFGPIAGAQFFYGQDAAGKSTGSETLWIPYAAVGAFVLILSFVFFFSNLPDIKTEDEFHLDDTDKSVAYAPPANRPVAMSLLWLNIAVLSVAVGMIISAVVAIPSVGMKLGLTENQALWYASGALLAIGTVVFLKNSRKITNHSIWSHPHFSGASLTQFFYVAAQCGIFAYFINYMTSQIPAIPAGIDKWFTDASAWCLNLVSSLPGFLGWFIKWLPNWLLGWFEVHTNGQLGLSDKGASNLASVGFVCFLAGRVIGANLLKKNPAHKVLFAFSCLAGACSLLVFMKLGWLSAIALFLTYFFMSIMFPTIFSLGIYGLGARAKKASSFIVMAIMGGAIMPKLMGHIADKDGMSAGFIVPLICFVWVACYGFFWSKLSGSEGVVGVDATKGH
jgi:MFS transporter, FHS family, L-fucose permease